MIGNLAYDDDDVSLISLCYILFYSCS